jgi:uncharacterized protein (DUF1330 family)
MKSYLSLGAAMIVGAVIGAAGVTTLQAQGKVKAYTVTELETLDSAAAATVAGQITKAQSAAGGRNLRTGGGKVTAMEGPPPPPRVAITEWDNLQKAEAFFKSKAWTDLQAARDKGLKTIRRYAVEVRG